jgi:DNA-binding response OmpR family regulator
MPARILIVEDNALIALDLTQALTKAGFEIIGTASTLGQALSLIEAGGCDAAVVDINLRGETSERVAVRLKALEIPFITLTGYSFSQKPAAFDGSPIYSKPADPQAIIEELSRLV